MKKYFFFLLAAFFVRNVAGQSVDTLKISNKLDTLGEVVISAYRVAEDKSRIAQTIDIISRKEIEGENAATIGDLLSVTGSAFVQRSQQGGGSPVVRGFEASRVLMVVDGIRVNNLIFRAGHLQNSTTFDQNVLDRIEIAAGPSSVAYGSDALGGTIHFLTKKPLLRDLTEGGKAVSGSAFVRYSTNAELTAHASINLATQNFATLTAITATDFGNLRMGKTRFDNLAPFGERNFYVERFGNTDSIVNNFNNRYEQTPNGYRQINVIQKFLYQQNQHISHGLNMYFTTSSDVPRYDRLTEVRNGLPRFAEWYYGPQRHFIAAYQFEAKGIKGFFNSINAQANFQQVQESRHQRNFRSNNRDSRTENVQVFGVTVDARRIKDNQDSRMGVEFYTNSVASTAQRLQIVTNVISPVSTRYPDGSNIQNTLAFFVSQTWNFAPNWTLNGGARATTIHLKSTFNDKTFFPFDYSKVSQTNTAFGGNVGLVFRATTEWKLAANISTGFRAPNVDDLSRVFESVNGRVVVPNPNIRPERTVNYELTAQKVWQERRAAIEASVFYTDFLDAIILAKSQFNGQDSIIFNGVRSQVLANTNVAQGRLWGASVSGRLPLGEWVTLRGSVSKTVGRITDNNNLETPLDHIPPTYGRMGVEVRQQQWQSEAFVVFNGWKRMEEYRLGTEDNEQYARPEGTPSWWTFNWRFNYSATEKLLLQCGIENILDLQYRNFASGINAAGRNFYATMRYKF